MNKSIDIQFKGLTTSPSDYACSDGEMAVCHNLVNENGELRPIMPPGLAFSLQSGCKLLYIHRTQSATMAVHADGSDVYASELDALMGGDLDAVSFASFSFENLKGVSSVGNILIITDSNSDSHYYRFANGAYTYLGKGLPQLPRIAFGLHNVTKADTVHYPVDRRPTFTSDNTIKVDLRCNESTLKLANEDIDEFETVFNSLMAETMEAERYASGYGGFNQPFFVRYAYRLYDGSTSRVSPAVLMTPQDLPPGVNVRGYDKSRPGGVPDMSFDHSTAMSYLRYCLMSSDALGAWSDIIEGVDVFISAPIRTYIQNMSARDYIKSSNPRGGVTSTLLSAYPTVRPERIATTYGARDTVGGSYNEPISVVGSDGTIDYTSFEAYKQSWPSPAPSLYDHSGLFLAPLKTSAELAREMSEVSTFYHIATIPLQDLTGPQEYGKFERLVIKPGVLETLTTRETLKEDYLSNYTIKSSKSLVYNSRLVKAGDYRDITTQFTLDTMTQYLFLGSPFGAPTCYVKLEKSGVEYVVPLGRCSLPLAHAGNWLFYPDPDAKELLFVPNSSTAGVGHYKVTLKRHEIMQGAYWSPSDVESNLGYGEFDVVSRGVPIGDDHTLVPVRSSIYVSEVNNPFVFPSRLSATVGNGSVMALAATTLPISEGQQGQFPVMAFTDEGIWALSVSVEGSLSATNPMLRDVLLSPESLCVIDDGVVYATKEGLRILRGKQSVSITDALKDAFKGSSMIPTNLRGLLHNGGDFSPPSAGKAQSWAKGCRIFYASALQRLYVLTTGMGWSAHTALVYSLTTGTWSSCAFRYKDPVDVYPTTYVQLNNRVYDVNAVAESTANTNAVVLTRPLTFGARNTPKTIMEAIVRGNINTRATSRTEDGAWKVTSDVNAVLYGSNDLDNWFVVASAASSELRNRAGTPYKYFRLLVLAPLGLYTQASIAGATFDVQPRLNNTLR